MKWPFVSAIVLVSAICLAPRCEAREKAVGIATCSNEQRPRALTAVLALAIFEDQETPTPRNDAAQDQTPSGYKPPEWVLPLVGIITVLVIGWQSWETRRAAQATQKSAATMESQTGILRESVTAAKDAAKAAKDSADATSRSIELAIQKERARIFVEVEPLDLDHKSLGTHAVRYSVIFHGSTFAFIEDASAEASFSDSPEPPPSLDYIMGGISIPKVIPPGTEKKICITPFWHEFDSYEVENIKHRKSFVHFRGLIKYKDFMGIPRETAFCYSWKVRPLRPAIGWEGWEKSGAPEANRET